MTVPVLLVCGALLAPQAAAAGTVALTTAVAPSPTLFGDVIHATIRVRAPDVATVDGGFSPFSVLRSSSSHVQAGGVVTTTWRFDLQCLEAVCAPGPNARTVRLAAARVRAGTATLAARLPSVLVIPRASAAQVSSPEDSFLHPTAPAPPTYRFSPTATRRVLLAGSALLLLAAAAVLWPLARPRREPTAAAELDPLGRALALVRASRTRPVPDRRRALGLLARTLRRARSGEPEVARASSDLAWSEPEPEPDEITRLADRVEERG